jgi:hypothetical protein
VPRIRDEFLDCVFHLYRDEIEAAEGANSGGTGFLASFPIEKEVTGVDNMQYLYAVTNRHLIDEDCICLRLNARDGRTTVRTINHKYWFQHEVADIAVAPLHVERQIERAVVVPREMFAGDDLLELRNIGIGDEVFFVGRFIGQDGKQRNKPSVRFGNISMMPGEPVASRELKVEPQVSFLVEARSLPGYSGSPAFTYIPPFAVRPEQEGVNTFQHGPFLLGIVWCYLKDEQIHTKDGKDAYFIQSSGMAGVVPAQKLIELLKYAAVRKNRAEMAKNYLTNRKTIDPPTGLH